MNLHGGLVAEKQHMTAKQAVQLLKNSGVSEAFLSGRAPTPLPDAEKRLQALVGALLKACDETKGGRDWPEGDGMLWASSVRSIIKNNA